jgi:hypothetical protein
MKKHIEWRTPARKRESVLGRVLMGAVSVAATAMLVRAMPDLVRYLRLRRM